MLRRLRTFPKIPLHRIPRTPLSTAASSPPPPPPPEPASESESADAEENSVVTREEAYRKIRNLDFSTATKILFTTPPKNKKFGLDFHLVQLFFVCLPSLGVYLVAQYARYEMRRMEAEAEKKKKQAEEEEKARKAELAPHEEGTSDAELSKVLVRLGALEEVVREIVEEKKITPHPDLSKKDKEVNKSSDPQSKPKPAESKREQNKVAVDGSSPPVSAPAADSPKAKDKGR
ncbi:uncharacterized protein M6B38_336420 [Iris pallida]|uniref:Uncharacterized protein n=1 Tax=Iris pallida TaxID=29817 RepID=A0AAX6H0B9_IRIPA|nr:uncharacterized protein M6B38_336420 [Iris pallida]